MDEEDVIGEILDLAAEGEPDALLELTVASARSDLYDASCEHLGGWDAALAAALCRAEQGGGETGRSSSRAESIHRSVGPEAEEPVFASTKNGAVFRIEPGSELTITSELRDFETPVGAGAVGQFTHVGDPEGLVLFTNQGHYFAMDPRMVPKWKGTGEIRRLENVLELEPAERVEYVLPRRAFYGGRIVHVTEGGKGKATEASEFEYAMDHEARLAFLLEDGDHPVGVMAVPEGSGVFCVSAHGRGIHFPEDELRSMGNRAKGVKVMEVDEEPNRVVDAFPARRVEQVAVLTRDGLGKRVDFSEFRPQGRGGAGMQLARLNKEDRIAAAAPCRPSADLVVTTDAGRVRRLPAAELPLMGRPAKGDRMLALQADERLLALQALPCGSDSETIGDGN